MKSLNDLLEEHPAPWYIVKEPEQHYEASRLWIKDANGKDVDVTGDDEEDALLRAYVEAVSIAVIAREWRDKRSAFRKLMVMRDVSPSLRNDAADAFDAADAKLAEAVELMDKSEANI